ncbi:MAG TPA: hypothetical protein VGJ03_12910 [Acidimicrobiales bacterium]
MATLSSDGSHATFTVQNSLPLCDPVPIGLAVYLKDGPNFVVPQTLADSSTDTIQQGSKTLSITLPDNGTDPHCYTQMDAFTGSVLPKITDTEKYGSRLLAYKFGELWNCGEESGSSTSSSTTSSTTSTTVMKTGETPTTPTTESTTSTTDVAGTSVTTTPASVLGVQTEQTTAPAPTTVAGEELARTGPRTNTGGLTDIAGALLVVGGALLFFGSSTRRPSAVENSGQN